MTRRDEWGQLLLTTPAVSHSLARHLGVPGASPGVPLEEEVGTGRPVVLEGGGNGLVATSSLLPRALCLHTGRPDCSRVLS